MKDVSRGQSAEESRCLSCTRRIGRGIRRTLAGMFLAAIMLGWPLMTAGGRAAGVPAVIATSNANQISERIAADPPSAPIGLTAKAGDAQVTLSSMVTHQITVVQHPSVNVLVDSRRVASLQLDLSLVFDVRALLAGISGGRLVALHSGRCDITVTLAVQGTELLTRQAHLELPGVVTVGRGIRLLPVGEYPADAYAGDERPSGLPAASRPWGESAGRVPPPGRWS